MSATSAASKEDAPYAEDRESPTLTTAKSACRWRRTGTDAPRSLIWVQPRRICGMNARNMVSKSDEFDS